VTIPNDGEITIEERITGGSGFGDFRFLGIEVAISAPAGTVVNPIRIVFRVDSSRVPPGWRVPPGSPLLPGTIEIYRTEEPNPPEIVQPCAAPFGQAYPDPCLAGPPQTKEEDGDIEFIVLSTSVSRWNFAVPIPTHPGKKLQIKDDTDPTKRKIVFEAKEDPNDPDHDIVAAVPATADDPTCGAPGGGGAKLQVFGTDGSGHSVTINLPCQNWTLIGKPEERKGFKYKDVELDQGPCRTVQVKDRKSVKATCSAKNPASPIGYDLTAEGERRVAVILKTGEGGVNACTEFTTPQRDDERRFQAGSASAPLVCPKP
jgi:hypothetical protein